MKWKGGREKLAKRGGVRRETRVYPGVRKKKARAAFKGRSRADDRYR